MHVRGEDLAVKHAAKGSRHEELRPSKSHSNTQTEEESEEEEVEEDACNSWLLRSASFAEEAHFNP